MSVEIKQLGSFYHLRNASVSYIMRRLENDMFEHVYFGRRLSVETIEDLEYLCPAPSKPSGAVKYTKNGTLALSDKALEYPVFGTGDFKTGAMRLERNGVPVYPDLQFETVTEAQGTCPMAHFPCVRDEEGAKTFLFSWVDPIGQYRVEHAYTLFEHDPVITRKVRIENLAADDLTVSSLMSSALALPDGNWELVYLSGNWAREFDVKTMKVDHADIVIDSKYGSSSHKHNPFTAFVSGNEVYTTNLIYSGNFMNRAQGDEFGNLRLLCGLNPETFAWVLKAGESFETPQAYHAYSSAGLQEAARVNQRFVQDHIVSPIWRNRSRPVVLNSWEAMYFDLNEKNLLRLAEEARAIGVDCFVVDDGWFGHRDNDRSSLGDWHADRKKFPDGLGAFARKIHDAGMQFGLWFEPEMVNEDAAFYSAHPAFVVRPPQGRYSYGRGQLVLDFANPACVEAVYAQMKAIIEQTKLDYIKWDMNRDVTEAYSPYLASQGRSQKEFYHRYIQGVYALHEKIANDFPHVLVEGCASGGGRFDAGILYYAPQIWTSDNTDAFARLDIQAGCALAYPMACMSNHISAVPNHQTFRKTGLTMREHVAVFGILGLELDLCQCAPKEKEQLKTAIAKYKAMQPLILNGTLYVHPKHEGWRAWTAIARNETTYLTGFYSTVADLRVSRNERVRVPDVDANAKYTIEGCSIDGAVLKAGGLRVPLRFNGANGEMAVLKGDFCSALTWMEKGEDGR